MSRQRPHLCQMPLLGSVLLACVAIGCDDGTSSPADSGADAGDMRVDADAAVDRGPQFDMEPMVDMGPEADLGPEADRGLEVDQGPEADMARPICARDDTPRRCRTDDDCGCLSHCSLGACVSECEIAADCADGERCDPFGRCRPAAARDLVPLAAEQSGGAVRVEQHQIIRVPGVDTAVRFIVEGRPATVRLVGRDGAQVQCVEGVWEESCVYPDVEPDTEQVIPVRVDEDSAPDDTVPSVEVNGPGQTERVGLPDLDQAGLGGEPAPIPGTYRGSLTLVADALEAQARGNRLAVPVTINVWGAAPYTVEIVDPHHVLGARGRVVGTLDADGELRFPAHPFFDAALSPAAAYSVAAQISGGQPILANGAIAGRLEVSLHGLDASGLAWTLRARRFGDADGEAPAVPAPVPLDDALYAEQIATPTPWEVALHTAVGAADEAAPDQRRTRGHSVIGLDATASAGGCFEDLGTAPTLALVGLLTPFDFVAQASVPRADNAVTAAILLAVERAQIRAGVEVRFEADPGDDPRLRNELDPGVVACAGTLALTEPGLNNLSVTTAFDDCAGLAERTGCTVEESERNAVGNRPRVHQDVDLHLDDDPRHLNVRIEYSHQCHLPTPVWCAGAIACMQPFRELYDVASTLPFAADTVSRAADLACRAGLTRSAGFPVDSADEGSVFTAIEVLQTCVTEAGRLAAGPPPVAGRSLPALEAVLGEERCVGAARLVATLPIGLDATVPDDDPARLALRHEARAFAVRLLSRWLALHAFFASEATEREAFARALRADGDVPPLLAYFDASDAGWDLMLHPRVAHRLVRTPADVLNAPDYRVPVRGVVSSAADEQAQPVVLQILVTLAEQARLFGVAMEDASLRYDDAPLARLQAYTPRALAAIAVARRLYGRMASLDPDDPPFAAAVTDAVHRWQASFEGLHALAVDVREGRDPLGISDADLPLYLSPDAEGASASRRFAAISDFLVGRGAFRGEVTALVDTAAEALDAARQAFLDEQERDYRVALEDHDHALWVDNIRDGYNAELRDYCGPVAANLVEDLAFDATSCMLNREDPACRFDDSLWFSRWTPADLLGRMCLATRVPTVRFISDAAAAFAEDCYVAAPAAGRVEGLINLEACDDDLCLTCPGNADVAPLQLGPAVLNLAFDGVPANDFSDPALREALADCQAAHPTMRRFVPVPATPFEVPGCVRGLLGEDYLDAFSASRAVESARAAIDAHLEAYDIAVQTCLIDSDLGDDLIAAQEEFTNLTRGLTIGRSVAEGVAAVAGGVKDCLSTAVGIDEGNPLSAIVDGALTIGTCVAAATEAAASATASGLQAGIEVAERDHELAVLRLEQGAGTEICMNDARLELVGMRGAALDLEEATFALQRATARIEEDIAETARIWADGNAYISGIGALRVPPPSGELWANDLVERFERTFRQARRAVYLAVRAVEYEFQSSLNLRLDALGATTPDGLAAVLAELRTDVLTGGIHGNRPADLTTVLSLRDDVLRLSDEHDLPAALHPLSPAQRLRVFLSAERYAQYDGEGRYLGQRIPFNIAPLGAFGLETGGVPIYSTTDCAERLWSVNASIMGEDVFEGSQTSFARIDLFKRNTFYSQWCGASPDGRPFQVASVRPARNLFRAPGTGEGIGPAALDAVREFSRARIQAFFGIDQAALEDPQYANGESTELAARGLYGDYALFIPAELISRELPARRSDGLVLDRIDDVLLRLDYVSVAAP